MVGIAEDSVRFAHSGPSPFPCPGMEPSFCYSINTKSREKISVHGAFLIRTFPRYHRLLHEKTCS